MTTETIDHGARSRLVKTAAVRSAHDAAAHDEWIRAKVAASLADPRPGVPHEQAMRRVRAVIDAKRQPHEQAKA